MRCYQTLASDDQVTLGHYIVSNLFRNILWEYASFNMGYSSACLTF